MSSHRYTRISSHLLGVGVGLVVAVLSMWALWQIEMNAAVANAVATHRIVKSVLQATTDAAGVPSEVLMSTVTAVPGILVTFDEALPEAGPEQGVFKAGIFSGNIAVFGLISQEKIMRVSVPWQFDYFMAALLGVIFFVVVTGIVSHMAGQFLFQMSQFDNTRAEAVDGLPEFLRPPNTRSPLFYREFQTFDQIMDGIASRHTARLEREMARIDAGLNAREKKAHVFASVSHDLKGPLNSIIGFTDLLVKGLDGPLTPEGKKTVLLVAEESERLLVMIGDILDTAKLDAGRFDLDCQWVPSVEILTDCEAGARKLIGTRPVQFICELAPGLPPVKVDRERISRAILGLIALAVDSLEKGEVRLIASKKKRDRTDRDLLAIDIVDTGSRMKGTQRTRLIEIFLATEGLFEKGEVGAAGLGLVLSRRVIRLHGGDVNVNSDTEEGGRGFIFSVTLPL